jgi:hypothetical protein
MATDPKLETELRLAVEERRAIDRMKERFDEEALAMACVALIIVLAVVSLVLFGSLERKASDARARIHSLQQVQTEELQPR